MANPNPFSHPQRAQLLTLSTFSSTPQPPGTPDHTKPKSLCSLVLGFSSAVWKVLPPTSSGCLPISTQSVVLWRRTGLAVALSPSISLHRYDSSMAVSQPRYVFYCLNPLILALLDLCCCSGRRAPLPSRAQASRCSDLYCWEPGLSGLWASGVAAPRLGGCVAWP